MNSGHSFICFSPNEVQQIDCMACDVVYTDEIYKHDWKLYQDNYCLTVISKQATLKIWLNK